MRKPRKSAPAVYRRIGEQLRDTIAREGWPVGQQLPSVQHIARSAGVSLRTADMAVLELVKEGVCYRRPKQGTFVARPISGVDGRKRVILMHSSFSSHDFSTSIIQTSYMNGIRMECAESGAALIGIYGDLAGQLEFYAGSSEMKVLGVVLTDSQELPEKIAALNAYPFLRFAMVNYRTGELFERFGNLNEIYSDEQGGGAWAAEYLWARGHRRIGILDLLNDSGDVNYLERTEGFRRRFIQLGGRERDLYLHRAEYRENLSSFSRRLLNGGAAVLAEMLHRKNDMTAVFGVEDSITAGAACSPSGKRLDFVGFDRALPCFTDMTGIPSLTVDYTGMARRAARSILDDEALEKPLVLPVTPYIPENIRVIERELVSNPS